MRPSPLYKRLGLTGPSSRLLDVQAGTVDLGDEVYSIRSVRGGNDLSNYTASTLTVETPTRVSILEGGSDISVQLAPAAATLIGDLVYEEPADLVWRYRGRLAAQTAHDKGDKRGQWRGTGLVGAAWASLYDHAPDELTPTAGMTLRQAAQQLFLPSWAPFSALEWLGDTEEWPAPDPGETHDPITAADLLRILSGRLYMLGDTRQGHFRVGALSGLEDAADEAADALWPLARAHCLAPTDWNKPSTYPTEYVLALLLPTGGITHFDTTPEDVPPGSRRLIEQDWTEIVRTTEQYRRIFGVRSETLERFWQLPFLTIRLDHLIASEYEAHRRAAGMLLRLNVGDPVPIAGDWPPGFDGVHFVTSLEEHITAHEWTLTLGLKSYRMLAGRPTPPVAPRTWAQARDLIWSDAGTATWNEGITV